MPNTELNSVGSNRENPKNWGSLGLCPLRTGRGLVCGQPLQFLDSPLCMFIPLCLYGYTFQTILCSRKNKLVKLLQIKYEKPGCCALCPCKTRFTLASVSFFLRFHPTWVPEDDNGRCYFREMRFVGIEHKKRAILITYFCPSVHLSCPIHCCIVLCRNKCKGRQTFFHIMVRGRTSSSFSDSDVCFAPDFF